MTKSVVSQDFGAIFGKIKSQFEAHASDGLVCKQGFYKNCFVLKLQKPFWTNDPMDRVQNESGIFFSIWIEEKAAHRCRANYNIHALKLRELKRFAIVSRDFAADFRKRFASVRTAWPNVSTDYGPLTLMERWIEFRPGTCEADILALMKRFQQLSPLVDQLLES